MISYLVGLALSLSAGSLADLDIQISAKEAHRLDRPSYSSQHDQIKARTALAKAAEERTMHRVRYDGRYRKLAYPNGDVPNNIGVCTDLVVRAYRSVGVDLQSAIHEDMKRFFTHYPSKRIWGLTKPDSNIDHRRVPNMEAFFSRQGESLAISRNANDYKSGDIVTWRLPGNLPHIGIVSAKRSAQGTPLVVHNIGQGPKLENVLFAYSIKGHYRYFPQQDSEQLSCRCATSGLYSNRLLTFDDVLG